MTRIRMPFGRNLLLISAIRNSIRGVRVSRFRMIPSSGWARYAEFTRAYNRRRAEAAGMAAKETDPAALLRDCLKNSEYENELA